MVFRSRAADFAVASLARSRVLTSIPNCDEILPFAPRIFLLNSLIPPIAKSPKM